MALKQMRLVIGGMLVVAAIGFLMFQGFQTSSVYYYTVSELEKKGTEAMNRGVRVTGVVDKSTVKWDARNLNMSFTFKDDSGTTLPVAYHGPVPDTFDNAENVVVEGKYGSDGVFHATTLFVQCPSKYEAQVTEKKS
ncbi:MAG: cytochrome c maturation protein CcmE [Chloroflexi bacterium]|nr:cytochrome c maturation protein CcmE [Chloroflexota bacterium]